MLRGGTPSEKNMPVSQQAAGMLPARAGVGAGLGTVWGSEMGRACETPVPGGQKDGSLLEERCSLPLVPPAVP